MYTKEKNIEKDSDYYLYTPSMDARNLYFYPTVIGFFKYQKGYDLYRNNFDSFLIMLIMDGTCELTLKNSEYTVNKEHVVLVDCYEPHAYRTNTGYKCLWMHFDGPMARTYYTYIAERYGNILTPASLPSIRYNLEKIYKSFKNSEAVNEANLSLQITIILNSLISTPLYEKEKTEEDPIQLTISYINENFSKNLHLEDLAEKASLSPYYFTKLFARRTGMTPYQYLISTRLSSAKFLLKSSLMSIKEIAFTSGFTDVSTFCSSFKKKEGITPMDYRHSNT